MGHAIARLVPLLVLACIASCTPTTQPSFGSRQMEQMLSDRPDMAKVLNRQNPIRQFVEQGFNSGDQGKRVYWFAESADKRVAFHIMSSNSRPAMLFVPDTRSYTPVDQWVAVVFELYNIQNKSAFRDLVKKGLDRKITPQKYANEVVKLEFLALVKTKEFFEKHPIDSAQPNIDNRYFSLTNLPPSPEAFLAMLDTYQPNDDNRNSYMNQMLQATGEDSDKNVSLFLKLIEKLNPKSKQP